MCRFLSLLHRSSNTPVTATVLHSVITVLMICVTTRHQQTSTHSQYHVSVLGLESF